MQGLVPTSLTIAQCVSAGVVVGLCALHWGWWRGQLTRSAAAGWTLAWSLVLAGVILVNGLVGVVPDGRPLTTLLLVRFGVHAGAILLSLPAVHAYTRGPSPRPLVLGISAWYLAALVLWLSTDLVWAHRLVDGLPQYGPLATAVDLIPLAVVGLYVARCTRGRDLTWVGAVVAVTGVVSSVLMIAASIPPPSAATELLKGAWVIPLVLGLQVLGAARISSVRREALRRAQMRDALAAVANAAWFLRTSTEILERGRDECRVVLADDRIQGTLRPLAKDRFVTEFYWSDGHQPDPDEQAFLRDMARVVSSAAERQRLTVRLRDAAFTDALTGLHNRHALDRQLTRSLDRAAVERTQVAVLFCDLDGLKHANDRHGHEWGDRLLARTAEHLQAVAGEGAFVARHGGDEFVVVLERVSGESEVVALAHRVRDEFEPLPGAVGRPMISVGVSLWSPTQVVDPGALIRSADLAMLEGKRSHAGVVVFDRAMRARVTAEADLRAALEAGISDGDIVAYFQPLTDAVTLEVVGLEVLARWRRDGRLRQPAEWLSFAEESGMIVEVGRQMFAAARAGMEEFDLPVAVNVAARQLDEPDFLTHVEESWGTDRWDRLTIEVTESALLYDAAHVRESLSTLAARGVQIALDDFGTGYNSLSRLSELPLDILKIDRTFVHDIRTPEGAAVLRAIIALAEAHGLEVVAEGVEHAEELMALVEMGVGTVQGHMLGRPAPSLPVRGARSRSGETSVAARHLAAVRKGQASNVGLSSTILPRRPLTKAGESSVDSERASSTASSTATASGTSSL